VIMKLICFAVLSLALVCSSFAEDVTISASVDKKVVNLGDVIVLTIYAQGTQSVSNPALPGISGFQSSYIGPIRQATVINGVSSVAIAHR